MSEESTQFNKPSGDQVRLIKALLANSSGLDLPTGWLESVEVMPMSDGGMGSMRLRSELIEPTSEKFGKQVSELIFDDVDGVKVIASFNVDTEGTPFEVDIWKTDYSALKAIPERLG